jgi:uncharacterized membrane protein
MQLLFAAPFLLAAGVVFTILSLIPRARRWGLAVPTGILGAAPFFVMAMFTEIALVHWLAAAGAASPMRWLLVVAALVGVAGGVLVGLLALPVAGSLPKVLLRAAVFIAGWCSYVVVLFAAEMTGSYYGWPHGDWLIVLVLETFLSFIAAFFIAKRSEDFRPRDLRLPLGRRFRIRGQEPPGVEAGESAEPGRA